MKNLTRQETLSLAKEIYEKVLRGENIGAQVTTYVILGDIQSQKELSGVRGWDDLINTALPPTMKHLYRIAQ